MPSISERALCCGREHGGMAAASSPATVRFEGAHRDDPLLRAEHAKKQQVAQALEDEVEAATTSNDPTEGSAAGRPEESKEEEQCGPNPNAEQEQRQQKLDGKEEAAHREEVLAKQRLVRSVLCTRITMPSADSVSNSVLRAVLRGDTDELVEASRRKRLKGVAVALIADERKRTALHLAVGRRDVTMVRALMIWRRELNHSLQDELDSLNHRRDLFIQDVDVELSCRGRGSKVYCTSDIDQFEAWLSEERKRLVRVTELRCEECWRKAVTARDDKGRTPLHWAAAVGKADDDLLQALLITGRADLSARDARSSHGDDRALLAELKAKLHRAAPEAKHTINSGNRSGSGSVAANRNTLIFPPDVEFHRRTGRFWRRRARGKAELKGDLQRTETSKRSAGSKKDPDGETAGAAKVKWFCAALSKTAEQLSPQGRGGAEAFLLSVFENFDRNGDGTMSLRQFGEALRDVNVRVAEQTLLEVGRYFQAATVKGRRGCRHHTHNDARQQSSRGGGHEIMAIDGSGIDIAYVPLVDVVFGRKEVGGTGRRGMSQRESKANYQEEREETKAGDNTTPIQAHAAGSEGEEDESDVDGCYVDIRRIRTARCAVLDAPDILGRPPLFHAAAAGAVSAAKTLIQHGAASALAVDGTRLTAHSVAPNFLMKRVLAAEARQSLDKSISGRQHGRHARSVAGIMRDRSTDHEALDVREEEKEDELGSQEAEACDDAFHKVETRRMEMWVSILADDELASKCASDALVDHKTSMHLASSAGLPGAVRNLLERGVSEGSAISEGARAVRQAWTPSWRSSNVLEETQINTTRCDYDHSSARRDSGRVILLKTDASGWSPLHSCCAESSYQHYLCALDLLGSKWDPNSRTNTGRTPLHVAACAEDATGVQGGGDIIPLLVSHEADLEAQDGDGLRPVHVAAKAGRRVALLALLTAGANPYSVTSRGWNALHYAVAGEHADATRLLAYFDSDSGVLGRQKNSAGATPIDLGRTGKNRTAPPTIWEAAARGDVQRLSCACSKSSRSPKAGTAKPWGIPGVNDKTPGLGFTPLHACMAGLGAIQRGLDVSPPCTPLLPGGNRGRRRRVAPQPSLYTQLVHERQRRNSLVSGNRGDSPSSRKADNRSHPDAFREESASGVPRSNDHLGSCRTLLSAAVDVDALDARCRTPLALAAAAGSMEAVEMLLKAGANPRAVDIDGNTAVHFAFAYANAAIGAVLTEAGGDIDACNREEKTPQDVAGLRALVAPADSDVFGETALMI